MILRVITFSIVLSIAIFFTISLIGITKVYAFDINTATVNSPKGSSHFDLDYYIIFDDDGNGVLYKNKNAKQTTLSAHKSDLLNGVFNPEDDNTSSIKAFFTKSFKPHSSSISFDKKYYLKNFGCTDGCDRFHGNVPSDIKKGTYQFVLWGSDEELYRFYITKATIK
jgi:hypothetical protein